MSCLTSNNIVCKQPGETIKSGMDFANWIDDSVTLSSPSVTIKEYGTSTAINGMISSVTVDGQVIEFTITGGEDGKRYRVEVTVSTSTGETLEGDGILSVSDR